jgi:hypothetical protein
MTGKWMQSTTSKILFTADGFFFRSEQKLAGKNNIHFGPKYINYITLPVIPPKEAVNGHS